jgi:VIT1/CCC1 family predicted Fe2+/Mn2+ transporter
MADRIFHQSITKMPPPKYHRSHRIGPLRAAVLGANDGIVSTSSLIIGFAAANAEHSSILLAGLAGLVSGALSMAAGEYVSVYSQADTEKADLELEAKGLKHDPDSEMLELIDIYRKRGLDDDLAAEVAKQMTEHDALAAHARDELGITDEMRARPLQAAGFSALSFSIGALLPIIVVLVYSGAELAWMMAAAALIFLGILGGFAANMGGANVARGAIRVLFWGAAAMILTAAVGAIFGTQV